MREKADILYPEEARTIGFDGEVVAMSTYFFCRLGDWFGSIAAKVGV